MKQSKPKRAAKAKDVQPEAETPLDAPIEISEIRETITRAVGNRAVAMVESTIAEARKGHYLAMKYLFEIAALYPVIASEDPAPEDSLARILLRNLGIPEEHSMQELNLQTKVTNELRSPADETTSHAVK